MELKGKHGYLHKIFDNELQIENFKKTIYDVSNNVIDVLYRVVGNDNSTIKYSI